jgi:ABC-type multidrug transport system ATPase subunit
MIRRLEIAQSMLHRPAVLFLDEPTVGLDPVAKRSVWARILDLRRQFGTAVLMTTHDMEEADHLCDVVAFLHQGHLVAMGTSMELKMTLGPEAAWTTSHTTPGCPSPNKENLEMLPKLWHRHSFRRVEHAGWLRDQPLSGAAPASRMVEVSASAR